MFRRKGNKRTFEHNKQIASVLSFIAGMVNVVGIIALGTLTTNITGHFGFFVDEVFKLNWSDTYIYFLYVFAFFAGSFVSNLFVEIVFRFNERYIYVIPALIEVAILSAVAFYGYELYIVNPRFIAFTLLFAMGLQNALVTVISNAIVRTTHLTGLFTDLGIELSQLFFYKNNYQKTRLLSTISLRFRIIFSFFLGGIIGGFLFNYFDFYTLFLPAFLLLVGIFYDSIKYNVKKLGARLDFITNSERL